MKSFFLGVTFLQSRILIYFAFTPKSRPKSSGFFLSAGAISAILLAIKVYYLPQFQAARILSAFDRNNGVPIGELWVTNPISGCVFPPEIVAPTIRWNDT